MSLMVKETEPEVALPTALGSPSAVSAELRGQHVVYCFLFQEIWESELACSLLGGRPRKGEENEKPGNETKFNGLHSTFRVTSISLHLELSVSILQSSPCSQIFHRTDNTKKEKKREAEFFSFIARELLLENEFLAFCLFLWLL